MKKLILGAILVLAVASIMPSFVEAARRPTWNAVSMYTLRKAHNFSLAEYFVLTGGGYKAYYPYTIKFEGPITFEKPRTSESDSLYMWVNCSGQYFCLPERKVDLGVGTWVVSVWDGADKVAQLRMTIK